MVFIGIVVTKTYIKFYSFLMMVAAMLVFGVAAFFHPKAFATALKVQSINACVLVPEAEITEAVRLRYAECLGWESRETAPVCYGAYYPIVVKSLGHPDEVRLTADNLSYYPNQRSLLQGNVEVQQGLRIVNAKTAYVYRDAKTNKVNRIELLGNVRYTEPDRLMIANKAVINPLDKSGRVEDVIYRFNTQKRSAILPAWGRASLIQRFPNQDYRLNQASYSNCAPQDNSWEIQAKQIDLDNAKGRGVARNAVLRLRDVPILYTPYISFPTNKDRKSGFLMPYSGYSDTGGYDLAFPYYWNMAPNYDMTLVPHIYGRRGLMMGGEFRFLTPNSQGIFEGNILPQDQVFKEFLNNNVTQYPFLRSKSTNRWAVGVRETTVFNSHLTSTVNFKQVSDDYYLQDFSTNLAVVTERQLLRQADIIYTSAHWLVSAMAQSYQTLNPVNESPVSGIYQRLPQIKANGLYNDLPFNGTFSLLGEYDQFSWAGKQNNTPQGPRLHLNPIFSLPIIKPWGFLTPSIELVENYYDVNNGVPGGFNRSYNRTIPRYDIDSGLYFDRFFNLSGHAYTQTLEPRLYYLYVPYRDQTSIPVYDSAYMIFNFDQLHRTNRFSGFDRIGDANQLAYSLTSRWISDETGNELASLSIGQLRYFANRRVLLCQSPDGVCVENPFSLGYLSPTSDSSPFVTRAVYHYSSAWALTGDYVWDPATRATNNAHLNLHYQPADNHIMNFAYTYLVNADNGVVINKGFQNADLHQATFSFAWPVNDHWSSLGAYSYNISKGYSMMGFLGFQYDSCCWALRLMGGQTFKSLDGYARPQYNNNLYLQILLKGLGSVASGDPYSTINTYIPGYNDQFHR